MALCEATKVAIPKALNCNILQVIQQSSGKVEGKAVGKDLLTSTALTVYMTLLFTDDGTAPTSTMVMQSVSQPATISNILTAMAAATADPATQAALKSASITVTGISTTNMPSGTPSVPSIGSPSTSPNRLVKSDTGVTSNTAGSNYDLAVILGAIFGGVFFLGFIAMLGCKRASQIDHKAQDDVRLDFAPFFILPTDVIDLKHDQQHPPPEEGAAPVEAPSAFPTRFPHL